MAIIKKAKNITLQIKHDYTAIAGKMEETAKKITVYSSKEDLVLNSNKKIVTNGNN
jgi:hypothetical protein